MPSLSTIRSGATPYISLSKPTILCFGGTSGIGEHIARRLTVLSGEPQLHLIGRNEDAAKSIIKDLKAANLKGSYHFHQCDLTLFSEIKKLLGEMNNTLEHVDILVASQGILSLSGRTETLEGNDRKMMLHYYSRMAVIDGMRSKLRNGARVMSVLDSLRGNTNSLVWDDLELKTHYSLKKAADHAVTMNDVTLQYFGQTNPNVQYFHGYPGVVATSIGKNMPLPFRLGVGLLFKWMAVPPAECAEYLCHALLAKDPEKYKVGTAYFCDNKGDPVKGKHQATSDSVDKVWQHTQSMWSK